MRGIPIIRASATTVMTLLAIHLSLREEVHLPKRQPEMPLPKLIVTGEAYENDSGTTHELLRLEVDCKGFHPFVLSSDDERGVIAPFPARLVQLDGTHAFLVGLSSPGGGMDRCHVLSFVLDCAQIVMRQELVYTTTRYVSQIVLSDARPQQIGIVLPSTIMPNEDDWELAIGPIRYSLAELRKLSPEKVSTADLHCFPGWDNPQSPKQLDVLWFAIDQDGRFRLVPRL